MKHTSFLYREFWLWFPFWTVLFFISLYFIGYPLLGALATGLLLTNLAAMAAFNNMDNNEIRKRNREELDSYIELLEIISSRYFSIKNICELCNEVSCSDDRFTRGLNIPELHITEMHGQIKYSKYKFIVKAMLRRSKSGEEVNSCLDLNLYIDMEARYHNLITMINQRNKMHGLLIDKVKNISPYSGDNLFFPNFHEYSKCMSFYEFSNFLHQTERIIIEMNCLLRDYKGVTKCLHGESRTMFSTDAIVEYGGMIEIPLYEDTLSYNYVNLSQQEQEKIKAQSYPCE